MDKWLVYVKNNNGSFVTATHEIISDNTEQFFLIDPDKKHLDDPNKFVPPYQRGEILFIQKGYLGTKLTQEYINFFVNADAKIAVGPSADRDGGEEPAFSNSFIDSLPAKIFTGSPSNDNWQIDLKRGGQFTRIAEYLDEFGTTIRSQIDQWGYISMGKEYKGNPSGLK